MGKEKRSTYAYGEGEGTKKRQFLIQEKWGVGDTQPGPSPVLLGEEEKMHRERKNLKLLKWPGN